jgi:hypothetical protein
MAIRLLGERLSGQYLAGTDGQFSTGSNSLYLIRRVVEQIANLASSAC